VKRRNAENGDYATTPAAETDPFVVCDLFAIYHSAGRARRHLWLHNDALRRQRRRPLATFRHACRRFSKPSQA
jgi:hypothetical protein